MLDFNAPPVPRVSTSIKYGYHGQVEPGKLKLELVSCDGGEHVDARHPATYLGPRNLLRHDKSVYCSERPFSTIVLRHADDTPFCLEKLHIVGPEHGFTAPVRDGLVYVAMTINDLQKYIGPPQLARRSGVHNSPYRRGPDPARRDIHLSPDPIGLLDALNDPDINAALDDRPPQQTHRYADPFDDMYYHTNYRAPQNGDSEPPCEIPLGSSADPDIWPSEGNMIPVTLLSDEETGPEENTSAAVLDFRLQRLRLMRRRQDAENWDGEDRWAARDLNVDATEEQGDSGYNLSRLDALMARSRVNDSPHPHRSPGSHTTDPTAENAGYLPPLVESELLNQLLAVGDPNVTCARFSIKRGKYKVAIKFEPGVSGRFLLLKLRSERGNVDVQSVIAKGYGGLRFFPAKSLV